MLNTIRKPKMVGKMTLEFAYFMSEHGFAIECEDGKPVRAGGDDDE